MPSPLKEEGFGGAKEGKAKSRSQVGPLHGKMI